MHRLYEAADRIEAQRLIDFLADHDIPAVVLGDFLAGAAGELPANIFPVVWIAKNGHRFHAESLLEEFLQPVHESGSSWNCPGCGETVEDSFQVCWNCGMSKPE
jgi:hypothetical protein